MTKEFNMFERVVSVFSPTKAEQLHKERSLKIRSLDAGTRRPRGTTFPRTQNINLDIQQSLGIVKERSVGMFNNNSMDRKACKTIALNAIRTGIRPQIKAKQNKEIADVLMNVYTNWAESKQCDFFGRFNFYGLQELIAKEIVIKGECLVLRRFNSTNKFPLQLQVLSGDQLDLNKSATLTEQSNMYISQGVEFDGEGRRVAYWIKTTPATNVTLGDSISKRFDAKDVLHIYEQNFIDQIRGLPFGVATMLNLQDLTNYNDAEILKQKTASLFAGFIKSPTNSVFGSEGAIPDGDKIQPGTMTNLGPGEDIAFPNPPKVDGFAEFNTKIGQTISAGFGVTYEQLTNDLSQVNYSSYRAGAIEATIQMESWQYNMFIQLLCDPIWEWIVEMALFLGVIKEPIKADWTPEGRFMIDPSKEVSAIVAQLENGLTSWDEVARSMGYNPEELANKIKESAEKLKELGLPMPWLFGKYGANFKPENLPTE